jgi:hypothetical protein
MIDIVDFKTCFGVKKKSEIIGGILVAYYSKINGILDTITSKNPVLIDQNTEWMCEGLTFLSTDYCYYKKTFLIIPSFQKQTP